MAFKGVDVTDLNQLAADLTEAGLTAGIKAHAIAEEYARNVRGAAIAFAPRSHTPAYPASITSDVTVTPPSVVAEVGPDKDKPQGALGNILEYGTAELPPQAHLGPAHDRHLPRALARLEALSGGIL